MTEDIFASDDALELIRSALRDLLDDVPVEVRASLLHRVAFLADEQRVAERERCVDLCRRRAEIWRKTPLAHSTTPNAREEARSRANEAAYLADLIATGQEAPSDETDA